MRRAIDFSLYLITDEAIVGDLDRVKVALAPLPPGTAAVQLRAKSLSARRLLEAAHALRAITRASGARLYVNDRVDVALLSGADGVHLPSRGMVPEIVRAIAPGLAIGVSTHDRDELDRAIDGGADFVTFGPVYPTPSKASPGAPVGIAALADAVAAASIPVFALGGIDPARARACVAAGARLACIRAILGAPDPAAGARAFLDANPPPIR